MRIERRLTYRSASTRQVKPIKLGDGFDSSGLNVPIRPHQSYQSARSVARTLRGALIAVAGLHVAFCEATPILPGGSVLGYSSMLSQPVR
jgi:hypothetical protein